MKFVFGTVRNPWDWYVSWYHGSLVRHVEKGTKTPFMPLYDPDFKQYLKNLFYAYKGKKLHDVDFSKCRQQGIGPYTFRFNKIYGDPITSNIQIIKLEDVYVELPKIFEAHKIPFSTEKFKQKEKVNASGHEDYRNFYDDETIELVKTFDRKIADDFNYTI